ncbi:MAG: hypothetical protein ACRC3Z_04475 [Phocaeicola sp.]
MTKFILSFLMAFIAVNTMSAKEVTIKAGTLIPLQVINATKATDLDKGQKVGFRVSREITLNGKSAIPYGTIVQGTVYEAKRSAWWGTKGRLGIKIEEIIMPDGTVIPLNNGDVYVTGKNQTAWSILVFAFTFLPIPCGTKAHLPNGYEIQANVASTTTFMVE